MPGRETDTEVPRGISGESSADLAALAVASDRSGVIWTGGETDLNVNLARFAAGEGVAAHINDAVEVLIVGVAGAGSVEIEGVALIVPRGARRATLAGAGGLAYLTCHRRRAGLWPARRGGAERPDEQR
jgi:hypothetical protein